MKRKNFYNSHQLRRIVSLDKIKKKQNSSPRRKIRRKKRISGKKKLQKIQRRRIRMPGEWRLEDVTDKILEENIFPFVDVYTITSSVSLVSVRFSKFSMKSLNGRSIEDDQAIDVILFRKPCDYLLFRLVVNKTINCAVDCRRIFQFSVKNNRFQTVRFMIREGIVDPSGWKDYAIQTACECGHLRIVKLLLEDKRVEPSVRDNYAIRAAWYNGHIEVVKCLLGDSKLKIGKDLGYIPDYVEEMMKSKGSGIVELMDSEDKIRSKENKQKKFEVIRKPTKKSIEKKNKVQTSKTKKMRGKRNKNKNDNKRFLKNKERVIDLSPIGKENNNIITSPLINPKTRKNLETIDDNKRRKKRNERYKNKKIKKKRKEEQEEEDIERQENNGNSMKKKKNKGETVIFERRLRELENFAKDMIFKRNELSLTGSSMNSSFGEEQVEELEKLRGESGMLKERLKELEKSIVIKEETTDLVLKKVRTAEAKRKTWKNILLTILGAWILVFVSLLILDFFYPVQLYQGFVTYYV